MKLPSGECYWRPLMKSQHWYRSLFDAARHQGFTGANVDPDLCHHQATKSWLDPWEQTFPNFEPIPKFLRKNTCANITCEMLAILYSLNMIKYTSLLSVVYRPLFKSNCCEFEIAEIIPISNVIRSNWFDQKSHNVTKTLLWHQHIWML